MSLLRSVRVKAAVVEGHFTEHWDRLLFRDYLIERPAVAKEYEALKVRLAADVPDRVAYTRGKTEFVVRTTEDAKRYFAKGNMAVTK